MIVGVFTPVINWCGGAEWVGLNIINALREQGHQVTLLCDKPLNRKKIQHVFNKQIDQVQEIVFPLKLFPPSDYHNLYFDALRMLILKSKCDVLLDTYSNAMLPLVDVSYIHHPLLELIEMGSTNKASKLYFLPYKKYINSHKDIISRKLIFANSKFTAEAIRRQVDIDPYVLYPPVSKEIFNDIEIFNEERLNNVMTISRICRGKNLESIPYIAKSTDKEISFTIVGLLDSVKVYFSMLKLIKQLQVADRVKIITNLRRKELREMLLNSKIYLHPTINEHFGISIVEAMSSGCIPIVHDSGGPKEFVSKRFRFQNSDEAAEKVEKTLKEWTPKKATKISAYAEKFSESNFAKQFLDIFNNHFQKKNF